MTKMSEPSAAPRVRTCIASRARHTDTELLRIVARRDEDGRVVVVADPHRRLPGRGAWLSPDLGALELAESKRAFNRALRVPGSVDTEPVRRYLTLQNAQQPADPGGEPVNDQSTVRKTEH